MSFAKQLRDDAEMLRALAKAILARADKLDREADFFADMNDYYADTRQRYPSFKERMRKLKPASGPKSGKEAHNSDIYNCEIAQRVEQNMKDGDSVDSAIEKVADEIQFLTPDRIKSIRQKYRNSE